MNDVKPHPCVISAAVMLVLVLSCAANVDMQEADEERLRADERNGVPQAQRVAGELYIRYERQLQRWREYRNLFAFLAFVALFLGVLYCQRGSETAYRVHSTIEAVVLPQVDTMQGTDGVYSWLKGLLTGVWTDPVCGDGVCEVPFEYAAYSSFGCRADCGQLSERQNLTTIQIDLYYDFSHPVGSLPASELMSQAAWNLCPISTPYSSSCYFSTDLRFDRLSGEQHQIITDAPDGQWGLLVKMDTFQKIRGAVRQVSKLQNSAYYFKVAIAALAATSEQDYEVAILQSGVALATTPYWTFVTNQLAQQYSNANDVTFFVDQLKLASCACPAGALVDPTDTTSGFTLAQFFAAFNNSIDIATGAVFDTAKTDYLTNATYCPGSPELQTMTFANVTDSITNVTTLVNITSMAGTVTAISEHCSSMLAKMLAYRTSLTSTVQQNLLDIRLGDGRTTGKIAVRNTVTSNLQRFLAANLPELVDPIFSTPTGTVPLTDPVDATLALLAEEYVQGLHYQTHVQAAYYGLLRSAVYSPTALLPDLATRAQARITEVQYQKADTAANILVPLPSTWALDAGSNRQYTVGQVLAQFTSAGLTNTSMPDPSTPLLNDFQITYNLANWSGNTTAYMVSNLALRGPSYVGNCTDMSVSCNVQITTTMGTPYICNNLASATNETITGNISDISYHTLCELPCDHKLDCNTVCECHGSCGQQQVCTCPACNDPSSVFALPAVADAAFISVADSAKDAGIASANIAGLGMASGRRRLQQADLATLLTEVGTVKTQQDSIVTQMAALQAKVDTANQLAAQRANDQTLVSLIQTGNQEIRAGQAAVKAQLDTIIGQENQALTLALAAAEALSAIKGLAQKQAQAQQALNAAVQAQLQSIRVATATGSISIVQALAIWKRARRDQALTNKAAVLANIPCNPLNTQDNFFNLTTGGNEVDTSTARERNIGLTNRVIGGMLLHQTRSSDTNCTDSKFQAIQQSCLGGPSLKPFGVDPVFKPGTSSYNPDLNDPSGYWVTKYYNCSSLSEPTYNVTFLNATTNLAPYCAELFNQEGAPYAFHSFPMKDKADGFPIWIDINLGAAAAQAWFAYVQEGLYLDTHTKDLTVELVTYNAPLRMFGYFSIRFAFSSGGSIDISHSLHTTCVELYNTPGDQARFAFEIILNLVIAGMISHMLWSMYQSRSRITGSFWPYWKRGWNWVDAISNLLLVTTMIMWWVYMAMYAKKYEISLRYDVYPPPLQPQANFLALYDSGYQLGDGPGADTVSSFANLKDLINLLNWYFALNGINILLLIARVLKLMDFQPRLGVVTRSLWLAGPDLIHFAIVAGMVFIGYSMMAHLIFGNAIQSFRSFSGSANTCFEILLGDIDVNADLRALGGLQSVAGALFFWSFELLVYMVLLNFLLAIIVDAFAEVKNMTHETVGIHTELYQMLRSHVRSLVGRFSPNYISDAKLGELLKRWAGGRGVPAARDGPSDLIKLVTVMNEELDEDTLRMILEECCKDAPSPQGAKGDATMTAREAKPTGMARLVEVLRAAFRPAPVPVAANSQELVSAAHYIVDRFGTVPSKCKPKHVDRPEQADDDAHPPPETPETTRRKDDDVDRGQKTSTAREEVLERERDQLASALERLAEVQRELADGQRGLMAGQKQLADQQMKLVALMNSEVQS